MPRIDAAFVTNETSLMAAAPPVAQKGGKLYAGTDGEVSFTKITRIRPPNPRADRTPETRLRSSAVLDPQAVLLVRMLSPPMSAAVLGPSRDPPPLKLKCTQH